MGPRLPAHGSPSKGYLRLSQLFRFLVSLYLLVAIFYTSYHAFVRPVLVSMVGTPTRSTIPTVEVIPDPVETDKLSPQEPELANKAGVNADAILNEDKGDKIWAAAAKGKKKGIMTYTPPSVLQDGSELTRKRLHGLDGTEWDVDTVHWHPPSQGQASLGEHKSTVELSEDHFLSLSFANALQPSKVIPYYYRATAPDQEGFVVEDITITTLITSNRFTIFERMVDKYQGPISATVHASADEQISDLLQALHDMYTGNPNMMKYVDIHLVYDQFDRQFNMWRNVAKFFARTDYVMMLDVDFYLCTDFRNHILGSAEIMERLRSGTAAFVVPAFEYEDQDDGLDPLTFPTTKEELLNIVKEKKIDMFHKSWLPGHGSTNYTRYYAAQPGEVYRVQGYTHSYEPYVIFKKEGTPWCDERFIGYGGNKAACLYELYLSGVSYYVLPDDFLIHQSHAYAEKARKHERKYNRKLYTDFREELCFRYLNMFVDQLDSSRAKNLGNECKKIKGFSSTAARFINAAGGTLG